MTDKFSTAIVAQVKAEGLTLIFPDSAEPSAKAYPYNKAVSFSTGERVFLLPNGGSYVVAFPLGPSPKS